LFYKIKTNFSTSDIFSNDNIKLEKSKEYLLTKDTLSFRYRGKEDGIHNLTISFSNTKAKLIEKKAVLNYKSNDFDAIVKQISTEDVYQGSKVDLEAIITPLNPAQQDNYKIIFNSFPGDIFLYDATPIQKGKEYDIKNIERFIFSLKSNQIGGNILTYTIKNKTVSKNFEITQYIAKREVVLENIKVVKEEVLLGQNFVLVGVVKNTPTYNEKFQYKTWISNTNVNGIQNTNNTYTNYMQWTNGNFELQFKSLQAGDFTLNFQIKDEFGNETEIKQFPLKVGYDLQIKPEVTGQIKYHQDGINFYRGIILKNIGGVSSFGKITKMEIKVTFAWWLERHGVVRTREYNYTKDIMENQFNYTELNFDDRQEEGSSSSRPNVQNFLYNPKAVIKLYNETGKVVEKEISLEYLHTP
ncbi:MAG: hypothetical protein Q4C98_10690, partial [Capnocytophaga sp.]|nr:hypothetical protein [Capnocytophaga sp.]